MNLSINRLIGEETTKKNPTVRQLDLFSDFEEIERREAADKKILEKERRQQEAVLKIKRMFGKNAILKGLNYNDGATQRSRNQQIGGHHE